MDTRKYTTWDSNYCIERNPSMTSHHHGFVLAGAAFIAVTFGLARYSFGLFVPAIERDLGLSSATIGGIASLAFLAYLLTSVSSGLLTPRFGPHLPTLLGGGCAAGGMALIGVASGPWLLGLGLMLAGASPGWAYPPMPGVAETVVPRDRREQALTWINAGTSFGVLLSGPLALWAGANWRLAWLLFAGLALLSVGWYRRHLPALSRQQATPPSVPLHWRWFTPLPVVRLLIVAVITGVTSAVFWTFAVDVLVSAGGVSPAMSTTFWVVVGVAGILGGQAGLLLEHYGLPLVLRGTVGLLTAALAGLGIFSSNWLVGLGCGVLFGSGFILMTGILAVWSVRLFPAAPSVGLGTALLLTGSGQVASPWVAGLLADQITLPPVFLITALVMAGATLAAPGSPR
jgi:predicted MFS family arabinose efflux permease